LGSIGGPAARLAQDCIRKVEVLEYEELGMEAVWRIEVENFPAFILVDNNPEAIEVMARRLEGFRPRFVGCEPGSQGAEVSLS